MDKYWQPVSISWGVGLACAAAAIVAAAGASEGRQAAARSVADSLNRVGGWNEAPAYLALFTPAAHRDAYQAFLLEADVDTALRALSDDPALLRPPGAWTPRPLIAADAFGQAGPYDRWTLARLYGAGRARVARGPRDGEVGLESWTLISPYPDQAFTRLHPGTLVLVLRLP